MNFVIFHIHVFLSLLVLSYVLIQYSVLASRVKVFFGRHNVFRYIITVPYKKSNNRLDSLRRSNYLLHQKMFASIGEIKEFINPSFSCPICNQGFVSRNAMYRHLRSDSYTQETLSCKEVAISQGFHIYPKDGINYDRLKRHTLVFKISFSDYTINLRDILEVLVQGITYSNISKSIYSKFSIIGLSLQKVKVRFQLAELRGVNTESLICSLRTQTAYLSEM